MTSCARALDPERRVQPSKTMPSPSLQIVLDRTPASYRAGERVCGHLEVSAGSTACARQAFAIQLCWGPGLTPLDGAIVGVKTAALSPYDTARLPFELALPHGAVSYHGALVRLDWWIRVVGGGGDCSVPITVAPAPARMHVIDAGYREVCLVPRAEHAHVLAPVIFPRATRDVGPKEWIKLVVCLAIVAAPFVSFAHRAGIEKVSVGFRLLIALGMFASPLSLFVGFLLVLTIPMQMRAWKERRGESALGSPIIAVTPNEGTGGQEIVARVRLKLRRGVVIKHSEATLEGKETVLLRGARRLHAASQRILDGDGATTLETRFRLPLHAAPSLRFEASDVAWSVRVNVVYGGAARGEWQGEQEFLVRPS